MVKDFDLRNKMELELVLPGDQFSSENEVKNSHWLCEFHPRHLIAFDRRLFVNTPVDTSLGRQHCVHEVLYLLLRRILGKVQFKQTHSFSGIQRGFILSPFLLSMNVRSLREMRWLGLQYYHCIDDSWFCFIFIKSQMVDERVYLLSQCLAERAGWTPSFRKSEMM